MAQIGGKEISTDEAVVVGASLLLFVLSFVPWFSFSFVGYGLDLHAHGSAWHTGFLSWAGVLLALAAGGWVALRRFAPEQVAASTRSVPAGPAFVALALAGVGALFVVLKLLIGYHGASRSFGVIAGTLVVLVEVGFALRAFRTSGEALPELPSRSGGGGAPVA